MDTKQLQAIWEQILVELSKDISKLSCDSFLKPIVPLSINEQILELGTPNQFVKEFLEDRYVDSIKAATAKVTNNNLQLKIINLQLGDTVEPELVSTVPSISSVNTAEEFVLPTNTAITATTAPEIKTTNSVILEDSFSLNPKYVFETFVTGNSNRFAHAAALAVAEAPAKVYNPFFMYGGVGLGKTHLMHAIGHRILEKNPNLRVLYISSEKFTNELINSIRDGNPESFRQKYRNIDVLLVDDIQFLSKKEHTQEEFFHTFNTLHNANKQIIISSDRPPREIQTLEDRLRSRFEWGLITDIQAPDLETRIAILRKKALLENLTVPNDVMLFIASRIDNNIRELEGALIRVMAYASLTNQVVTNELVSEALKMFFHTVKPKK